MVRAMKRWQSSTMERRRSFLRPALERVDLGGRRSPASTPQPASACARGRARDASAPLGGRGWRLQKSGCWLCGSCSRRASAGASSATRVSRARAGRPSLLLQARGTGWCADMEGLMRKLLPAPRELAVDARLAGPQAGGALAAAHPRRLAPVLPDRRAFPRPPSSAGLLLPSLSPSNPHPLPNLTMSVAPLRTLLRAQVRLLRLSSPLALLRSPAVAPNSPRVDVAALSIRFRPPLFRQPVRPSRPRPLPPASRAPTPPRPRRSRRPSPSSSPRRLRTYVRFRRCVRPLRRRALGPFSPPPSERAVAGQSTCLTAR